jgi:alpha-tubulin suppressor-like RCC1 family protein
LVPIFSGAGLWLTLLTTAIAVEVEFPLPTPQRPASFPLPLAERPTEKGTARAAGNVIFPQAGPPAQKIAAGQSHSMILRSDGTVMAWGANYHWQAQVPPELREVASISAGSTHSMAIKTDGTLVGWGGFSLRGGLPSFESAAQVPPGLTDVMQVACGNSHTIALRKNGTVVAWGSGMQGGTPLPNGLRGVVQIAAGARHGLALQKNGTVVAWGNNSAGQRMVPPDLHNVVEIAAGGAHSLARRSDGTLVSWGDLQAVPPGLTNITQIGAGSGFSVVLQEDGSVIAWGKWDEPLLLFPEDSGPDSSLPIVEIAVGSNHVLGRRSDGSIVSWGANWEGQSLLIEDVEDIVQVSSHNGDGALLKKDGSLVLWGHLADRNIPDDLSGVASVIAGSDQLFVLLQDGTMRAFLRGFTAEPAGLSEMSQIVQFSKGSMHQIVLLQDGTVVTWGGEPQGGLPKLENLAEVVQVEAGGNHTLVLHRDGSISAWGANFYGQSSVPETLNEVVQIAAGEEHSVALQADGTVVVWGNNHFGQCNVPVGLTGVVQIAARGNHTLALKSDGSSVAWGDNEFHQSNVSGWPEDTFRISAGLLQSVGIFDPSIAPYIPAPLPLTRVAGRYTGVLGSLGERNPSTATESILQDIRYIEGSMALSINPRGLITIRVVLQGSVFQGRGQLAEDQRIEVALRGRAGQTMQLALELVQDGTPHTQYFRGTAAVGADTYDVLAGFQRFQRSNPLNLLDRFIAQLAVQVTNDRSLQGTSVGTVRFLPTGSARMVLMLADGTRLTATIPVWGTTGQSGELSLLLSQPHYRNQGHLAGWMTQVSDEEWTGLLEWQAPPSNQGGTALFPDGFNATLESELLSYDRPGRGEPLFTSWPDGQGRMQLSSGGLPEPLSTNLQLRPNQQFAQPNPGEEGLFLTLRTQLPQGTFSGVARHSAWPRPVRVQGVIDRPTGQCVGFFLTPDGSGLLVIEP